MSSRVKKALEKYIIVSSVEMEMTEIIHGESLSIIIDVLDVSKTPNVIELSDTKLAGVSEKYIAPRAMHAQGSLAQLSETLGLEIWVKFFEIEGIPIYFVEEPVVTDFVKRLYIYIKSRISETGIEKDIVSFVKEEFEDLGLNPKYLLLDPEIKASIYYVWRDVIGYGPIQVMMEDPDVEEISWYSYRGPIMVVDKEVVNIYPNAEFIYTNVLISPSIDDYKKKFIMSQVTRTIVSRARSGLTTAKPISEARVQDSTGVGFHRLAAHSDIISHSPAFTIRKFPKIKHSLTLLISKGTLNELLASYLLIQLLKRGFVMIVGGMGSGKTTLLQALISALPTTYKVITIEDTPELSTPSLNWHPLYTRPAPKESELENIDHSRLVIHSLRHRGTIVTLGEARGREFAFLVQAAASGHGAICTFHADDPFTMYARVTSPPIDVSPESLKLITSIAFIMSTKTFAYGTPQFVRRVVKTFEIRDVRKLRFGDEGGHEVVFAWDPMTDKHYPAIGVRNGNLDLEPLAYLWEKSDTLKVLGRNIYGDNQAERVLMDVLALSLFLRKKVSEGVFDIRRLHHEMTKYYLQHDAFAKKLWELFGKSLTSLTRK